MSQAGAASLCAPGGNRTPDRRIRRPLLYPLSYWGTWRPPAAAGDASKSLQCRTAGEGQAGRWRFCLDFPNIRPMPAAVFHMAQPGPRRRRSTAGCWNCPLGHDNSRQDTEMTDNITVRGFVASEIRSSTTPGGVATASFRLGSTDRRYDRALEHLGRWQHQLVHRSGLPTAGRQHRLQHQEGPAGHRRWPAEDAELGKGRPDLPRRRNRRRVGRPRPHVGLRQLHPHGRDRKPGGRRARSPRRGGRGRRRPARRTETRGSAETTTKIGPDRHATFIDDESGDEQELDPETGELNGAAA